MCPVVRDASRYRLSPSLFVFMQKAKCARATLVTDKRGELKMHLIYKDNTYM